MPTAFLTTPASLAGTRLEIDPTWTPMHAAVRVKNLGPAPVPDLAMRLCADERLGPAKFAAAPAFSGTLAAGEGTIFHLRGHTATLDEMHRSFAPGQTWLEIRSGADVILCLDMPPADADADSTLAAAAVA